MPVAAPPAGDAILAPGGELSLWVSCALALGLLLAFVLKGVGLWGQAPTQVQGVLGVALRSAIVYTAMVVPTLLYACPGAAGGLLAWRDCPESPLPFVHRNMVHNYHWLPFWYCFAVTTHFGCLLKNTWQTYLGVAWALTAMSLMNFLMPGGAGLRGRDPKFTAPGWLPGGFDMPVALGVAVAICFVFFASRRHPTVKMTALGTFAGLVVEFINPATTGFRAVLVDWDLKMNWDGNYFCFAWLAVAASLLSVFSLGLIPCSRRSRERHTCLGSASKELSEVAADTSACLEWLLTNFRHTTKNFDTTSTEFYIRQLGARRSTVESLLADASWECFTSTSRARLWRLRKLAELLQSLRRILFVELEHLRCLHDVHGKLKPCASEISEQLEAFLQHCRGALSSCVQSCTDRGGLEDAVLREHLLEEVRQADAALLESLRACGKRDRAIGAQEVALVDRLRSWPMSLEVFVRESAAAGPAQEAAAASSEWREEYWMAFRNTVSWTLALLWCVYKRGYNPGCVITVSFLFPTTSGSTFDRNVGRMLGIGLGLAFGTIPSILVAPIDATAGFWSLSFLPRALIYLVAMFMTWAVAMYGCMVPNSKHGYACLIWAAFAGVHMLGNVPTFHHPGGLMLEVIDNYVACLVIFAVDLVFLCLSGDSTQRKATESISQCVGDIARIVDSLTTGGVAEVSTDTLADRIKTARFWDNENRQESMVWIALMEEPYRGDLGGKVLDLCDDAFAFAYSIKASAQRCGGDGGLVSKVLAEELGGDLSERCVLQAKVAGVALRAPDANALIQRLGDVGNPHEVHERLSTFDDKKAATAASRLAPGLDAVHQEVTRAVGSKGGGELERAAESAAVIAMRLSAMGLTDALRQLGSLIATNHAMACKDWKAAGLTGPRESAMPSKNGAEAERKFVSRRPNS